MKSLGHVWNRKAPGYDLWVCHKCNGITYSSKLPGVFQPADFRRRQEIWPKYKFESSYLPCELNVVLNIIEEITES